MERLDQQDKEQENDLTVPNDSIIKNLTEIVGEADAQKFLEFAQELDAGSIELCT